MKFTDWNPRAVKRTVVAGAAAATDITVTGIVKAAGGTPEDEILHVMQHDGTTKLPVADLVDEAAITADGKIQLSTTDTTGDTLVVEWLDKSLV